MKTSIGALSGKPLSVLDELTARAAWLASHMPDFNPDDFCFLVSEEEWNALRDEMALYQRSISPDSQLPVRWLKVHEIEVRKR